MGLEPVEVGPDPDVQAVVKGLLNAQRVPTEKYDEPATAAQEVGWYSKPLVAQNPRFVHGLKGVRAAPRRRRRVRASLSSALTAAVRCPLLVVRLRRPSLQRRTRRRWRASTCSMASRASTSSFRGLARAVRGGAVTL